MKKVNLLVVMILLLCTGCNGSLLADEGEKTRTIGVLLKAMNSQHCMEMSMGIQDAARKYGAEVILLYPQEETQGEQQEKMFADLLAAEPDVILFAACDSDRGKDLVEHANQKGIPVFALDTPLQDVAVPYIGADNWQIGRLAAERMDELLGRGDQVAIISGAKNQLSHRERIEGFQQELERRGRLSVVDIGYADAQFALAMSETANLRAEYPELKGIFATSAVMTLGVMEECKADFVIYEMKIIGVDTQTDVLSALEKGILAGLVTQDGYEMGYRAVETAMQSLAGEEIADQVHIETQMLTKANVKGFLTQYLQREGYDD